MGFLGDFSKWTIQDNLLVRLSLLDYNAFALQIYLSFATALVGLFRKSFDIGCWRSLKYVVPSRPDCPNCLTNMGRRSVGSLTPQMCPADYTLFVFWESLALIVVDAIIVLQYL